MRGFRILATGAAKAAPYCLLLIAATASAQTRRPIGIDDLLAFHRISEPQVSPDGASVVYTVATPDRAGNTSVRNIWIVPTAGGPARQITASGKDSGARWSPDGKRLAFVSSRDGDAAVYTMPLTGGEPARLTTLSGGAENIFWSPDSKWIAFTSQIYPDCKDDACNAKRAKAADESKIKAHVTETLLYRHWTQWRNGQRGHLFVVSVDGGTPKDLTPGADYDVPPLQREGPHPIAFSPDGKEIAFTAVVDPMEAASTNGDIFTVPADAVAPPKKITTGPGFDGAPAYSPDGKWIAFHSQAKPGVESDRWRLMRYDRASGQATEITPSFDRSVDAIAWSPDSASIYFDAEDTAYEAIFSVAAAGGTPTSLTSKTYNG